MVVFLNYNNFPTFQKYFLNVDCLIFPQKKGNEMINALVYNRRLIEAGFSEKQAGESILIWIEIMDSHLVNKTDLSDFRGVMKEDFFIFREEVRFEMTTHKELMSADWAKFRKEMRAEFAEFKQEMRTEFSEFKQEMRTEFEEFRTEIRKELSNMNTKLDVLSRDLTIKLGSIMITGIIILDLLRRFT